MKRITSIFTTALVLFVFACTPPDKQNKVSQTVSNVVTSVDTIVSVGAKPVAKTYTKSNSSISYERATDILSGPGIPLIPNDTSGIFTFLKGQDYCEAHYPIHCLFDEGEQDILPYDKGEWKVVYKTITLANPIIVNLSILVAESRKIDSATINQIVDTLRQVLPKPKLIILPLNKAPTIKNDNNHN